MTSLGATFEHVPVVVIIIVKLTGFGSNGSFEVPIDVTLKKNIFYVKSIPNCILHR